MVTVIIFLGYEAGCSDFHSLGAKAFIPIACNVNGHDHLSLRSSVFAFSLRSASRIFFIFFSPSSDM